MSPLTRPLVVAWLLLAGAAPANASGESAGLAAAIGMMFLGGIAALALVVALVAVFVPKLTYARQIGWILAFVAIATVAFGLLFRMQPSDIAFNFAALAGASALVHAGLHHAARALLRAWRERPGRKA